MSPRSDDTRSRANLQTITLEYIVNGRFDGVTVAPQISIDPNSPNYVAPDPVDQVRRVVLPDGESIGLIDLSLVPNGDVGGVGDRYVRWVFAGNSDYSQSFVNGLLGVYDDLLRRLSLAGDPLLLETVRTINGVPAFYDRACTVVPQGAYLGIYGMSAPVAGRNFIRINVQAPMTDWEAALVEESCCCDSAGATPPPSACPTILDISPSVIASPGTLTIFGSGFRDGLAISAERNFPGSPIAASLTSFTIIDSETATVDVVAPTPPGTYTLTIFDPADPITCTSSGQFAVADLSECANFASEDPVIPTSIAAGNPGLNMIINGTGLLNVASVEIRDNAGGLLVSQNAAFFDSHSDTQIDTGAMAIPLVPGQPGTVALIALDPFECDEVTSPITITGA